MSYEQTTVTVTETQEQIKGLLFEASNLIFKEEAQTISVDFSYIEHGTEASIVMKVPLKIAVRRKGMKKKEFNHLIEKRRMAAWRSAYWLIKNLLHVITNKIIITQKRKNSTIEQYRDP
jgi:hypothetical protein